VINVFKKFHFQHYIFNNNNGCFFKFGVKVGVELSIVNALYRLRITDQLFKSYAFTRVVRSQSTLQRLLRRQIKKNTLYTYYIDKINIVVAKEKIVIKSIKKKEMKNFKRQTWTFLSFVED
jgi:hypothetical protein